MSFEIVIAFLLGTIFGINVMSLIAMYELRKK